MGAYEYQIDWGDNTNSGWTDFTPSGTEINASHVWTRNGTYSVTVKAKDIYGTESEDVTQLFEEYRSFKNFPDGFK